jgi:hypothetical protein
MRDLAKDDLADKCHAKTLVIEMKPSAAAAYLSLFGTEPAEAADTATAWLGDTRSFSPKGHYNYACLLAREHPQIPGIPAPENVNAEAVMHLRLASAAPDLKESMAEDPWLSELRDTQEYKNEFTLHERRKDFLSLEALTKHADHLRDTGLDSANSLAKASDWRLSQYLKIDRLVAERLIRLAQVATMIPPSLGDFQVEITAALLNKGVNSPAGLLARLETTGSLDLAKKLLQDIQDRCKEAPSLPQLTEWLESILLPRSRVPR